MLLAVFTLGVASSPTVQSVSHSDHTVCGVEYMEGEWRASKSGKILYEVSAFNASKANSHHPGPVPRPGALGLVCKESESGGKLKNHCGWQSALCYTHPSPSPSPTLPRRVKLSAPEAGAARYSGSTLESKAEHSHNHPGEATTPSRLACTFYSHNGTVISKANGTITTDPYIRSPCSEISGWTNDTAVSNQLWYRTYKKMTCASFVENDVCKTCSGGCGNPANCVTCTTQFMSPHGNSEAFYICDGGLEEIRESCNATVGRKPTPVIATNAGKIQGFIDPDSKHAAFRGIPYAQPPVGDLRWRPPQPPTPWTDVKNVSKFGNTCKQMGPMWATMGGVRNSSEDCLYLNVYAPAAHLQKVTAAAKAARAKAKATATAANTSAGVGAEDDAGAQATEHTTREAGLPLLPVMIYFPAGQFMWGSGNDAENFNAPQTAAGEQIIVVTMNYRLGAAGYLALDELKSRDPTGSTGNYGSQDQRAALKWIHDNIAAFGGDPKNTVLWGESAGAAAVTAHLSMEKSWPYFDKAIIESGAFNGWSYKTYSDAVANGVALAKHLNCTYKMNSTASVSDITSVSVPASFSLPAATVTVNVTCMLGVSIDTLVYMDDDTEGADGPEHFLPFADRVDKSLWSPAIDNVELFDTPTNLLKANKVAPVPILFGTNRDEGSTFTYNQTGIGDGNGPNSEGMYDGNLFDWPQMLSQYGGLPSHPQNLSTGLFQYQSDFESWIFGAFGKNATSVAAELVKLYRPANSTTPPSLGPTFNPEGITNWWWSLSRVIGDFVLSCPARQAARLLSTQDNRSVYLFHFNHTPSMSLNQAHTDQFGAFHGSEVPFVYYATIELEGEQELKLSEAIVQYWAGFAYNGDPNIPPPNIVGGLAGLPPFPRFVAGKAEDTLILGDTADGHAGYPNVSTVTALKEVECNFWDKLAAAMADQDWS